MCSPVGNEGPTPRVSFDQTFFAQRLHRLAYRSSAHTETLSKFALRGKLVARLQCAVENGLFYLLDDLLVQARSPNDFIHGNFSYENGLCRPDKGLATIPHLRSLRSPFCGIPRGKKHEWF